MATYRNDNYSSNNRSRNNSTFSGSDRRGESRTRDSLDDRITSNYERLLDSKYKAELQRARRNQKDIEKIQRKAMKEATALEIQQYNLRLKAFKAAGKQARVREALEQRKQDIATFKNEAKLQQELTQQKIDDIKLVAISENRALTSTEQQEINSLKNVYDYEEERIRDCAKQEQLLNRDIAKQKASDRARERKDQKELNKLADPKERLASRIDANSLRDNQPELRQKLKQAELNLQNAQDDGADESVILELQELVQIAKENLVVNSRQLNQAEKEQKAINQLNPLANTKQRLKDARKSNEDRFYSASNQYLDAYNKVNDSSLSEEERNSARADMHTAEKEMNSAMRQEAMYDLVEKGFDNAIAGLQGLATKVDATMESLQQYQGSVNARLQGTDKTYKSIQSVIQKNLGLSPIVKMTDVLNNVNAMLDSGVTYNTEYRAFLNTISNKIATTFDATNETLLRIVRIQQGDSSAARMGMEASLTRMLNSMYEDSSYLTNAFDNVSSSLVDAISTMSKEQGLEYEYTVQKWLGSLSSLGLSDSTISQLATGLNYVATGDVTALASNTQLQTLMAMSAARAGLDYADLLKNGMTTKDTNDLLQSMVIYLKEIAEGDNLVVKSAYGDIYGFEMGDLASFRNITQSDISTIYGQNMTYEDSVAELQSQMIQAVSRTSLSEMMGNLFDNVSTSIAESVMNNPAFYALYKINGFIKEATGGINIPFISAFGTGLDLNANVNDLLQLGIIGAATLSNVETMIGAIGSVGKLLTGTYGNASGWEAEEWTSRGGGFAGITGGASSSVSESSYVGNSSSSDMEDSTLNDSADDAESKKKKINKHANNDKEKTSTDIYKLMEGKRGFDVIEDENGDLALKYKGMADALKNIDAKSLINDARSTNATSNISTESIFQLAQILVAYTQTQGQELGVKSIDPLSVNLMQVYSENLTDKQVPIKHNKLDAMTNHTGTVSANISNKPTVNIGTMPRVTFTNKSIDVTNVVSVKGTVTTKMDADDKKALTTSETQKVYVTNASDIKSNNTVTINGDKASGGLSVKLDVASLFSDLDKVIKDTSNKDPKVLPIKIVSVDSSTRFTPDSYTTTKLGQMSDKISRSTKI